MSLLKTALYELSCESGARMVAFAGYHMPIQYSAGIVREHLHVREKAGLFDISHMGQIRLTGKDPLASLQRLVPSYISKLSVNRQQYSVFTNEAGGVLDDLMIMNLGDEIRLVVNAACKHDDLQYLKQQLHDLESMELLDISLLALQGPMAASVLQALIPEVSHMKFMDCGFYSWQGNELLIARCGYTGEDGFEISIEHEQVENFVRALLSDERVALIGLGARDSLRLEAGLCLYGQDLSTEITPVEAGLNWVISQQRIDNDQANYPGADVIAGQLKEGAERIRVGVKPYSRAPLRTGAELLNEHDEVIGVISSGGFGASVNAPVAMAYVSTAYARVGEKLKSVLRGKTIEVEVCELPFISHNYNR